VKADDFLSQATRELRSTGDVPASEVDAVRARIMTTMRKSKRRSARTMLWAMPIAAVLAASTALATSSPGLRRAWHELWGRAHLVSDRNVVEAPKSAIANTPRTEEAPAPPTIEPPEAPAPTIEAPPPPPIAVAPAPPPAIEAPKVAPKAVAPPSSSRREPEPPAIEAAPAPAPQPDRDTGPLALYKKAHRLHFQEQNWARALDAWNDYLREQPNGSLSVEARYNRAIALVRLGRRDEARAALTPFARGEVAGGYRASEAKSLLAALDGSAR
jgi:hypothetical protein